MTQEELALSKIKVRTIRNIAGQIPIPALTRRLSDTEYINSMYKQLLCLIPIHKQQWEAVNNIEYDTMIKVLEREKVFLELSRGD